MKHFVLLTSLIMVIIMTCITQAHAAPGDTTWIQAQNNVQLDNFGDWDENVNFPSSATTYRKIIMVFTLGKYQCPAGTQYCGDWDYTIQNYLMTSTDTFELSRLITPYANASYPRTPFTWKQRYYFDVTDFYPVLKGGAKIRLAYHNYSGGFTGNIKFAFIEGTPPRNVTGIKRLWNGSFAFGSTTDPIENHFPAMQATAPAGTQSVDMKFTVTGHGSDGNYCSEFCSKSYQVLANSALIEQKQIWRDNCGENNLYPQSGTWIYDRANWCPGDLVYPNIHKLGSIAAGNSITADVNFENYSNNGGASYIVEGILFFYGGYNQTTDAAIERIVSPSDYEGDYRVNPMCGSPVVKVKNTGSTTINSVSFQYGIVGQSLQTYTATGLSIAPSSESDITLANLPLLAQMPASSTSQFTVSIQQVNGVADGYALNNTQQTSFVTSPDWPSQFYLTLRSNNYYTETSWKLYDMSGAIIKQRTPAAALTSYNDLIGPLNSGCYKLVVSDAGCDGLYWWANSSSTGLGAIFARTADLSAVIPFTNLPPVVINGSSISVTTASQDFGCGFTQYFRVGAIVPLDLLSFSGKADAEVNHLYWKTAREVNTHHFDVEFSATGNDYTKVAEVRANGNTSGTSSYTTTHIPAVKAPVYYYRLKMVDADGSFKYSNVVTIKPTIDNFIVTSTFPNPFNKEIKLNITATRSQQATISFYDIQGRQQYAQQAALQAGINNIVITGAAKLTAGVYLLEVNAEGQKFVQKVIKD